MLKSLTGLKVLVFEDPAFLNATSSTFSRVADGGRQVAGGG